MFISALYCTAGSGMGREHDDVRRLRARHKSFKRLQSRVSLKVPVLHRKIVFQLHSSSSPCLSYFLFVLRIILPAGITQESGATVDADITM